MEWNEDKNPYEVLQLETGVDSSEDEIKKARVMLAAVTLLSKPVLEMVRCRTCFG